ncbi:MAG: hypothetical protein PF487_08900 [Bacteroidales bacterium]|jgi:Na+/proline symporter|nr:hypothetical protein [Bacteroidales bacterium]
MTIISWILLGIIYFLMIIILKNLFKRFEDNNWTENYMWLLIVWPMMIVVYTFVALIEGFKYMYNNEN